jgi:subtilisin family serine protease
MLGPDARKIQPKLRMIANCSTVVNTLRAEHCSSIAITRRKLLKEIEPQRGVGAIPVQRSQIPRQASKGKLQDVCEDVQANVFIVTADAADHPARFPGEKARKGNLVTATTSLADLKKIAGREKVTYIELAEPLSAPKPIVSTKRVSAPRHARRRFGSTQQHHGGKDVLIGLIDVQGFDFAHPDFLDAQQKHTRFVRIWDQGGTSRPAPKFSDTQKFDYGSELKQEHLNAALKESGKVGVAPQDLEAQSQMTPGSHGTHVASIAAGNRGVCPRAMIAGVLISLPDEEVQDRRTTFYDSTRLAHAVDYLLALADELKVKAVSINVSLGTNGHAHDASAAISRWIDAAMVVPGRCITVAAGNAGQEISEFEGDIGYVMGRIHTSGRVPMRELYTDIEWLVVGNGMVDISENELELWYSAQDRFAVSLRPPGMDWIGPVEPRQYIENHQLKDGSLISIYNELYHTANGSNSISLYLSPFLNPHGTVGIRKGRWMIRLFGREVRDGHYHAWIERDDPRPISRMGKQASWNFPSFFSERSNVDNSSVSSLACGRYVISVANLDEEAERIHISSSQGPTRDARSKPDVAAPGTNIVAAKGFAGKDDLWVSMTGTSMSSPFICGLVGLMFAIEPQLTAAQIEGIIQRTARPLPGADFNWLNDAGFGRIDPEACLAEAATVNQREAFAK